MPIDQHSTIEQARAQYLENASYAETADPLKAAKFATAIRALLLLVPRSHGSDEMTTERDLSVLRAELDDVNQWLRDRGPSIAPPATSTPSRSRTTRATFADFRS